MVRWPFFVVWLPSSPTTAIPLRSLICLFSLFTLICLPGLFREIIRWSSGERQSEGRWRCRANCGVPELVSAALHAVWLSHNYLVATDVSRHCCTPRQRGMDGQMDREVWRYKEGEAEASLPASCKLLLTCKETATVAFSLHLSIHPFTHSFIHLFQSIIKPTLLYSHLEC